jgi:hypothetical protein
MHPLYRKVLARVVGANGWQAGSYLTASLIMQMNRIVNPNTFKLEWKCSDDVGYKIFYFYFFLFILLNV